MQRMGKGLPWNGASTTWLPVVFLPQTINGNWSYATSTSLDDSSYEVTGPQVFRFEYYYLLKNGTVSSTPWYTASSVRGMQDVTAIVVDVAVIDLKSKVLADNSAQVPPPNDNITRLTGQLVDYSAGLLPGQLLAAWRTTIDANSIGLPRPAISGIRVYERYFYLNQ